MSVLTLNSTATQTPVLKPLRPTAGFSIPDFWKMCSFPVEYNKDGDLVSLETQEWFETVAKSQAPPALFQTVRECGAGELAGYAYSSTIPHSALRLVSDFLLLLFIMDDLSDLMDDHQVQSFEDILLQAFDLHSSPENEPLAAKLVRDWWTRVCLYTPAEGWKARVVAHIKDVIESMKKQAEIRVSGYLPPLDDFIRHRRYTGGVIPAAAMIELGLGIELPEEAVSHPLMCIMLDSTNDFVCHSNDVFSYANECKTSDTHNILILLQKKYGMDLQTAVNYVGALATIAAKTYQEAKAKLPSFGPKLDKDVAMYCKELENWFVGHLDWSFVTLRYLGDAARRDRIRKTLWVDLEDPTAGVEV